MQGEICKISLVAVLRWDHCRHALTWFRDLAQAYGW